MVHTWKTIFVVVKVVDKSTGETFFVDPEVSETRKSNLAGA